MITPRCRSAAGLRLVVPALALSALLVGCGGDQKKKTSTGKDAHDQTQAAGAAGTTGAPESTAGGGGATGEGLAAPGGEQAVQPVGLLRAATSQLRSGQYEQAIRTCKDALRRNEKYVPAMVVMARAYFHLNKAEFAEAMCVETALKIEPRTGECYHLLGHIALKQDNRELALKNFEKATQVQPGLGAAWLNYGALLVEVKNFSAAVPALKRAVELLPNRPEAYVNLGSALRGDGKLVEARQAFVKALGMRPRYPAALFNLGILYLDATQVFDGKDRLRQLDESIAYLNQYKASGRYSKDDPANDYIDQAHNLHKKEKRRIEMDRQRKAREAARKAQGKK